jgi:hypothetical protein
MANRIPRRLLPWLFAERPPALTVLHGRRSWHTRPSISLLCNKCAACSRHPVTPGRYLLGQKHYVGIFYDKVGAASYPLILEGEIVWNRYCFRSWSRDIPTLTAGRWTS